MFKTVFRQEEELRVLATLEKKGKWTEKQFHVLCCYNFVDSATQSLIQWFLESILKCSFTFWSMNQRDFLNWIKKQENDSLVSEF